MVETSGNELMVLYDSNSAQGGRILAYARMLDEHVKGWDYSMLPLAESLWKQLLQMLQLHPEELLDKSHPYYQSHIAGQELDEAGWINVLRHNTFLIKSPIAVKGGRAVVCHSPQDLLKLV